VNKHYRETGESKGSNIYINEGFVTFDEEEHAGGRRSVAGTQNRQKPHGGDEAVANRIMPSAPHFRPATMAISRNIDYFRRWHVGVDSPLRRMLGVMVAQWLQHAHIDFSEDINIRETLSARTAGVRGQGSPHSTFQENYYEVLRRWSRFELRVLLLDELEAQDIHDGVDSQWADQRALPVWTDKWFDELGVEDSINAFAAMKPSACLQLYQDMPLPSLEEYLDVDHRVSRERQKARVMMGATMYAEGVRLGFYMRHELRDRESGALALLRSWRHRFGVRKTSVALRAGPLGVRGELRHYLRETHLSYCEAMPASNDKELKVELALQQCGYSIWSRCLASGSNINQRALCLVAASLRRYLCDQVEPGDVNRRLSSAGSFRYLMLTHKVSALSQVIDMNPFLRGELAALFESVVREEFANAMRSLGDEAAGLIWRDGVFPDWVLSALHQREISPDKLVYAFCAMDFGAFMRYFSDWHPNKSKVSPLERVSNKRRKHAAQREFLRKARTQYTHDKAHYSDALDVCFGEAVAQENKRPCGFLHWRSTLGTQQDREVLYSQLKRSVIKVNSEVCRAFVVAVGRVLTTEVVYSGVQHRIGQSSINKTYKHESIPLILRYGAMRNQFANLRACLKAIKWPAAIVRMDGLGYLTEDQGTAWDYCIQQTHESWIAIVRGLLDPSVQLTDEQLMSAGLDFAIGCDCSAACGYIAKESIDFFLSHWGFYGHDLIEWNNERSKEPIGSLDSAVIDALVEDLVLMYSRKEKRARFRSDWVVDREAQKRVRGLSDKGGIARDHARVRHAGFVDNRFSITEVFV
jgi:hypothetical protein